MRRILKTVQGLLETPVPGAVALIRVRLLVIAALRVRRPKRQLLQPLQGMVLARQLPPPDLF